MDIKFKSSVEFYKYVKFTLHLIDLFLKINAMYVLLLFYY